MARKRKSGPRTKSGRLRHRPHRDQQLRDHGTEEGQMKRKALVGEADPALAATALGILFARGYLSTGKNDDLDRDRYTEGLEFGRLRACVYGTPWPSNAESTEPSDERLVDMKRRLRRKEELLTDEEKHVLDSVCRLHRLPHWFWLLMGEMHALEGPEDREERELLLSGLDALVQGRRGMARSPKLTIEPCLVSSAS